MARQARRRTAATAVVGVLGVALASLVAGTATAAPRTATAAPTTPPPVPAVVLPATSVTAASPSPSADPKLAAALTAAMRSKALGTDLTVSVIDVASGAVLVGRGDTRPQQPASSLKVLTAVTVLHEYGDDARLSTSVVTGATPTEIVLVGGGDSTLTRVPAGAADLPAGQSARPASMSALVAATVKALRAQSRSSVTLKFDDTLFTGPRTAEGWPDSYVSSGVVSPVSALSVDGGRTSAASRPPRPCSRRSACPSRACAWPTARDSPESTTSPRSRWSGPSRWRPPTLPGLTRRPDGCGRRPRASPWQA